MRSKVGQKTEKERCQKLRESEKERKAKEGRKEEEIDSITLSSLSLSKNICNLSGWTGV